MDAVIAGDQGVDPTTGIEMPLPLLNWAGIPDGRGLAARLVLAIDGEADIFELVGHIVADLAALILGTYDKDEGDG